MYIQKPFTKYSKLYVNFIVVFCKVLYTAGYVIF